LEDKNAKKGGLKTQRTLASAARAAVSGWDPTGGANTQPLYLEPQNCLAHRQPCLCYLALG